MPESDRQLKRLPLGHWSPSFWPHGSPSESRRPPPATGPDGRSPLEITRRGCPSLCPAAGGDLARTIYRTPSGRPRASHDWYETGMVSVSAPLSSWLILSTCRCAVHLAM